MEAFIKWRCSKCRCEYSTQEEAAECEAHHGNPVKVRKGTRCPVMDLHGVPSVVDVLMDNGRVVRYRYDTELDKSAWDEQINERSAENMKET